MIQKEIPGQIQKNSGATVRCALCEDIAGADMRGKVGAGRPGGQEPRVLFCLSAPDSWRLSPDLCNEVVTHRFLSLPDFSGSLEQPNMIPSITPVTPGSFCCW